MEAEHHGPAERPTPFVYIPSLHPGSWRFDSSQTDEHPRRLSVLTRSGLGSA